MILSNASNYGIRAICYIAAEQSRQFVPIREISENLSISFHFLTKILQKLTQKDLLLSYRGPSGGVALTRAPENINLMEIVEAIEGQDIFKECILGLDNCGDDRPCPLHYQWMEIRGNIRNLFESKTVREIAEEVRINGLRLKNLI